MHKDFQRNLYGFQFKAARPLCGKQHVFLEGIESQIANVGRATNGSSVHKECGFVLPDIINLNINKHATTRKFEL
jgi:hypothetical protein